MRHLDRFGPLPLRAQLLGDLRDRLAGDCTHGFPTDLWLTTDYGASHHIARRAVRRLQAEGVVRRERGRGTVVGSPTFEQPGGATSSLPRSIAASGSDQRSAVLDRSVVTDAEIPGGLGLLLDVDLPYTALDGVLEACCGVRLASVIEWFATELPDVADCRLLVAAEQSASRRSRRSSTAEGLSFEGREAVIPGDRYTSVAEWSPTDVCETALRATEYA